MSLRVLWQSNSPVCNTGYGMQTAAAVPRLQALGHKMAYFAFYGFEGSKMEFNGIPLYPNDKRDWGVAYNSIFYNDHKADILLTLQDTWVLQGMNIGLNWVPWCVTGDTKVITPEGEVEIEKASDVKEVLAISPEGIPSWVKVTAYHKLPCVMDVYEIVTDDCILLVTGENDILTDRGWIPANCIETKDMVYCLYAENHNKNTVGLHSRFNRWRREYRNNHPAKVGKKNPIPVMGEGGYFQPERTRNGVAQGNTGFRLHQSDSRYWITPYGEWVGFPSYGIHIRNSGAGTSSVDTKGSAALLDNQEGTSLDCVGVHQDSSESPLQQYLSEQGTRISFEGTPSEYARWQRVRTVRKCSQKIEQVFDLTTETGNFFANNILIHNCPIDHDPAPPEVLKILKNHAGIVKPIAMSKFGHRKLKEAGIDSYYIPHGVNTHLFSPQEQWRKDIRKQHGWEDKFVIGTVGTNTVERKNWIASLKAVKEFYSHHKDVVYYMHTDMHHSMGIDLDELRSTLGLTDITFYPKQEQMIVGVRAEALAHLYNAMDVFLLPSKGEGFGIPIIEAQACGVPVITTNCTAQPELIDGGWLVKDLTPTWTAQTSWQFDCNPSEIALYLEEAYQEWKSGNYQHRRDLARAKALEYEWDTAGGKLGLIDAFWKPTLEDIEKKIHEPKNREGIQEWRIYMIPHSIIPRKVLDIGCGVTQPYKCILERLGDYTGIDLKEGPGVTVMDCHHLPYEDKEFGFVWMSEVLEHLDNPEQAIAEAKRVSNSGVCLFSTPMNPFFKMDPEHKAITNISYTTLGTGDGLIAW